MPRASFTTVALGVAVALVLADSSVVILALPAILEQYDAEVAEVAWVVTSFNLALAVAALPAAYVVRRIGPSGPTTLGLVGFAAASLLCAAAPSLGVLIGARAGQAVAGAFVLAGTLELLARVTGDDRRGSSLWVRAGVIGAAVGPAVGGLLTQLLSWESIFIAQAPLALVAVAATLRVVERAPRPAAPPSRPLIPAHVALVLLSGALTAALFLIVLLLIEGWRQEPIVAALTVTVMPLAAIAAAYIPRSYGDHRARAIAGAIAIAAGLGALALLPGASPWWTVPPQIMIGLGLGLAVEELTSLTLAGREPLALHGGAAIASRHAGVVIGLLLLTPVFTTDLDRQTVAAERAGAALVLDARIEPTQKVELALEIADELRRQKGQLPDLGPAFAVAPSTGSDGAAARQLARDLEDQIQRAGTHAFSRSFAVAAALALLALIPLAILVRRAS